MQKKDFNVAIIGGGICGLTLAIALSREGIQVDLFESAPKFTQIGAGLGIGSVGEFMLGYYVAFITYFPGSNSIQILKRLGVLGTILSHTGQEPVDVTWKWYGADNKGNLDVLYQHKPGPKETQLPMHRHAFLEALSPLLPSHLAHFDKRCVGISQTPGEAKYTIYFSDGSEVKADIVVGADGIKSTIRQSVTEGVTSGPVALNNDVAKSSEPRGGNLSFTGVRAYRALIPIDVLREAGLKMEIDPHVYNLYIGENKYMIAYPISSGKILNIALSVADPDALHSIAPPVTGPWVLESTPNEEVVKKFTGWNEDLGIVIKHMGDPKMWAIHHINPPLQHYARGGVVLVGDAAHASTPFLGAGLSQGLEDIAVLKELLVHPDTTSSNIQRVLMAYDRIRPTRGANVTLKSFSAGKTFMSYPNITAEKMQSATSEELQKIYNHDLDADINAAIQELKSDGTFVHA